MHILIDFDITMLKDKFSKASLASAEESAAKPASTIVSVTRILSLIL
jgi:hypothetical protein